MSSAVKKICRDPRGDILSRRFSQACRGGCQPRCHRFKKLRSIRLQNDGVKRQIKLFDLRMSSDRRFAGSVKNTQEGPLRIESDTGRRIEDGRKKGLRRKIVGSRRDGDRALSRRWNEFAHIQNGRDFGLKAKPPQAGKSQKRGIDLAFVEFGQAGLDIAAQQRDVQIRPQPLDHGAAPQRGRADRTASWEPEGMHRMRRNPGVAHIFAREIAGDDNFLRKDRWEILGGMDRQLNIALHQGEIQLLSEESLAANFAQGHVGDDIAAGFYDGDFNKFWRAAMCGREASLQLARLSQREGTTARAELDGDR